MKAQLIHLTPNALELCAGAMSKCYDKQVSSASVVKYGVQSGHLSVLEHATATFDLECSLGVLGQITRHRHFSFTVMSTRGAEMTACEIPDSLKEHQIFVSHFNNTFTLYKLAVDIGIPLQDAAYLLPKGTITKLRVTGNLRAWLEYLPKRLCKRAMPEHRELAMEIKTILGGELPEVFGDVAPPCSICKETKCSF